MNTEIFRFTAVRTPQQAEASKIAENTISLFNRREESDLVKALQEARQLSLERLVSVAEGFAKSNKHIKSLKDVPPSFSDFNDFLLANTGDLDVSKIKEAIEKYFQSEAKTLIGTDKFKEIRQNLSDSLLSSLILRNTPTQVQSIQARLLRIIGVIEKTTTTQEDKINLFKLVSISFILPKGIFPLPIESKNLDDEIKKQREEEEKLNKQKAEEKKKTIEEIEKMKATFSEIQTSMEEEKVRINSSTNPNSRITKKGFYLETSAANKLSQTSKAVVGGLNFNLQRLDTSVLLPKLESKISDLSQKLNQDVNLESKIYKVGNTFVVDFPLVFNGEITNYEKMGACAVNVNPTTADTSEPFIPDSKGNARVLGIMDLLLVEQKLLHYEKGEIAHIENVLIGEIRERKHRRTLIREESTFSETEITEENEKDLTSTERYELQTESQKVIEESLSYEAGVTANVYGVRWDVSANANIAGSTSTSESNSSSSNFAREITTKAVSKLTNRTLERRSRRTVEETEENNLHSFNNVEGEEHITGVYRWLDKIYEAQVVRYGKRLMLEFVVPEPAVFYRYAAQQQPTENISLSKPEQPGYCLGGKTFRNLRAKDITRENYLIWANKYNASNVASPPPSYQIVGDSFAKGRTDLFVEIVDGDYLFYHAEKVKITIPNEYYPETAKVLVDFNYIDIPTGNEDSPRITVEIEDKHKIFKALNNNQGVQNDIIGTYHLSKLSTEALPISISSFGVLSFGITITILCKLSDAKFEEWQLKTFTSIMEAYNDQKARYESQLEAIRIQQGFGNITGRNPIFNRETERTELKKGCITLLSGQRFEKFNAVQKNVIFHEGKYGQPEIVSFDDAHAEGKYIQFFEQSIEWTNMLYVFYPYFWAEKSQWVHLSQLNDDDALFTKFLQAGSARVQVPVRLGYESNILNYINDTAHFDAVGDFVNANGDDLLQDLHLSILDELKEGVLKPDDNSAGEPVGETWKVRVPTSLVIIDSNYLPQ